MAKLNTTPLGGTRDHLPLDVLRRAYVIESVERIYQSYGFEPLETPAMERLSTLLGKYGEEGDQLIFRLLKRGQQLQEVLSDTPTESELSEEGLRYDLTVPLARVIAEHRHELPPIFKRYQIQPVYRADRPAKGRYREFHQCDVDIAGTRSLLAEAEVVSAGCRVLQDLGFEGDGAFTVRLNHRGVLKGMLEVAGVTPEGETDALVAIDKLDKVGLDGVRQELLQRGIEEQAVSQLLDQMNSAPHGIQAMLAWLPGAMEASEPGKHGAEQLRTLVGYLRCTPAADHLQIDPYLARGLSYYTGAIFEVVMPGVNGTVAAGGRYDDLLGMFSGQSVPAVGFSLGLERILLVMQEREMFPDQLTGQPQVLVTQFDESTIGNSLDLARTLRTEGFRVDVYPDLKGYGAQFKYAGKRQIRFVLLLSPREIEVSVVAVRDLTTGEQIDIPWENVGRWLSERV